MAAVVHCYQKILLDLIVKYYSTLNILLQMNAIEIQNSVKCNHNYTWLQLQIAVRKFIQV